MTQEQKLQVRDALIRFVARFDTQAIAAAQLQGITPSAISQIKNDNWDLISERVWHQVARQVGFYCGDWHPADTGTYLLLRIIFSDAQHYAMTYAAAIGRGLGKTFTAGHYVREQENVCYLSASADYNCRSFIIALLQAADIDARGTTPELINAFISRTSARDEPLIIIDNAHMLKDRVLHRLVTLIHGLTGRAGFVIMGSDELRQRIIIGVQSKRVGFDDIYKAFGRRFITLGRPGPKDAELICRANGITNENIISSITEECSGNFHNIASLIEHYRQAKMAA